MNKEELQAFAAQKQRIVQIVADMVEQAKAILMDAKQISDDAGIEFGIESMVYEVGTANQWYNSNSTC